MLDKPLSFEKMARISGLSLPGLAYLLSQRMSGRRDRALKPVVGGASPMTGPIVVVVPDVRTGEELLMDLEFFVDAGNQATHYTIDRFFGWEILPFDALSPAVEISSARLTTLHHLQQGERSLIVAPVDALFQRLLAPDDLLRSTRRLAVGDTADRDELVASLDLAGYVRSTVVEERGQMAVRGAVVDLFPPDFPHPLRFELYGDRIESIRGFDSSTQRSLREFASLEILPVREVPLQPEDVGNGGTPPILARLLERGAALDLSSRDLRSIEEAYRSGARWPGMEHLLPLLVEKTATFWDYFPRTGDVVVFNEPAVLRAAEDFHQLLEERAELAKNEGRLFPELHAAYVQTREFEADLQARAGVVVDTLEVLQLGVVAEEDDDEENSVFTADQRSRASGDLGFSTNQRLLDALRASRNRELPFEPLAEVVRRQLRRGFHVVIAVSHAQRLRRMRELLASYEVSATSFDGTFGEWFESQYPREGRGEKRSSASPVILLIGSCSGGLVSEGDGLHLIVDREIFPETSARRRATSAKQLRRLIGQVSQFNEGDYIVHVDHGIAIYRGLRPMTVEGKVGDFLFLEYADGAKLFLPVDHIAKVQKYSGAEGKQPVLTKLGAKTWNKTKAKVKETVAELAGQLVTLYAQRELAKGFSFGAIDEDDRHFSDTFPFEETPDQAKAIEETLADMASERPMDRLICGDVGYGKTEVALRAAFKAVNRGKQVAVLVPTTVLADQHYNTFRSRFADFPFRVACVSRFFSNDANRETIAKLASGDVDIIVGTHRLFSRDVSFHELGLLVIDEEHRFGVAHKEKLKRMRREIDVLTLTATPIPRTLHMSLVGIRDLSVIETPPTDRQVIRTYLSTYEDSIVREAILRELQRSGQVFYIWNRVESIANIAAELRELVPEAKVEFAHGQMRENELEAIMHRFLNGEIQVLLSTTIVESGLDIPNANTIIIRDADRFGLAELYQLRGRVGRSSRRAFAYLLISDPHRLGPDARKRLQVLQALDDLGMGFRLALQDMEIRGAGNLLGKDQSGHIALVGFELYSRILKEAIREIQARDGDGLPTGNLFEVIDPEISVGFPAHIPPFYIPDVAERLLLYQRLVELREPTEGSEISEEIRDRFGNMPREVESLVELMILRSLLRQNSIVALQYRNETLRVAFHPEAVLDTGKLVRLVSDSSGRMRLAPGHRGSKDCVVSIKVPEVEVASPFDIYQVVRELLVQLGIAVAPVVIERRMDA